ncbi:protein MIS12 homolog [Elgaria multicarinata webbii]|uniref:protein MIS12 homolog n=1 Tax=Elgaria multicarinata webbii TaxID=159646 RepID=UPI002FCCEB16
MSSSRFNTPVDTVVYETQFFGFTPQTFMLRIYFAFQDHLSHIILVAEEAILNKMKTAGSRMPPSMIRKSTEQFFSFMRERFEKLFAKMEETLLKTVLSVPKNVLLPEDKAQEEFRYTAERFQELQEEISRLEQQVKAETQAEQALRAELEEQKVVQDHLEGILQWFDGLDGVGREEGTGNLKESFAALTKTAVKLQDVVGEVGEKMKWVEKQ